jgi:hypothetical protein
MQNQNREIYFYVVRSPFNPDYYSIHSVLTDRLLMDKQTLDSVKEFLEMNNPAHPILATSKQVPLTELNREEYLKSYHLYNTNYILTDQIPLPSYPASDYTYTTDQYVTSVSDNDTNTRSGINSSLDCDSDPDADSYGDSNHLPYITGRIGHPGD